MMRVAGVFTSRPPASADTSRARRSKAGARNWHHTAEMTRACSEFEDAVAAALIPVQRAEPAAYRERPRARLAEMARAEAEDRGW